MSAHVKAFLADLANAKQSQFDNVHRVERGDSDGEVSFKYTNDLLQHPLEIQILATGTGHGASKKVELPLSWH